MIAGYRPGSEGNKVVCAYVADGLKLPVWDDEMTSSLAVFGGAMMVGGVVFHDWRPEFGVIELSLFGNPGWFKKPVWDRIGRFCTEIGCNALRVRTDEDNRRVIRVCRAVGFEEYRIPHLRGHGRAEVNFVLTQDGWQKSRFKRKETA